jgi:hypothetical protein
MVNILNVLNINPRRPKPSRGILILQAGARVKAFHGGESSFDILVYNTLKRGRFT